MKLLVLLALVGLASTSPFGSVQSIAVTGKLLCNGAAAENVKVKLYEREIILDTLLDEKVSDRDGRFKMSGHKNELSTIDPKVNIYHKCNYNGICFKKVSIKVPKNFVTPGEEPEKTFDIGEINLAGSFSGESTDCLN